MASAIRPEFLAAFRRQAGAGGSLSFSRFMALALYDPEVGYYATVRHRIGLDPAADYFTSQSLGPVFGELLVEACHHLLGGRAIGAHTVVEIGAERRDPRSPGPPPDLLAGVPHPFAASRVIPLGGTLAIPALAIVLSNELFDAQPLHRLVRRGGRWRELGVALRGDRLEEVECAALSPEVRAMSSRLPVSAPEEYHLDLPLAAAELARRIGAEDWNGLFVAFDYGKSWRALAEDTPQGTVRAYHRHRQDTDLLARPGEQDLTGHVCWDWIADALTGSGFAPPVLESQEEFLVRHAGAAVARIASAEAARLSERKLGLMQLLHPGDMGRKFQVLWARREGA
jgi:SAM-dependent MidA family methyltransferase